MAASAATSFIANSIGRGVDLYLDRIWIDSLGGIVGSYFPPINKTWPNLLLWALCLTVVAYFVRRVVIVIATWFQTSKFQFQPEDSEAEIISTVLDDPPEKETYYSRSLQ